MLCFLPFSSSSSFRQHAKNANKMEHAKKSATNATCKTKNSSKKYKGQVCKYVRDKWSLWQGWTRRGEGSGLENVSPEQALWPWLTQFPCSDIVICISLIKKHVFLWFCYVYFSASVSHISLQWLQVAKASWLTWFPCSVCISLIGKSVFVWFCNMYLSAEAAGKHHGLVWLNSLLSNFPSDTLHCNFLTDKRKRNDMAISKLERSQDRSVDKWPN